MRTFAGKRLRLECDAQGVSVEGARLRNDFTLGNNGIVHMIDDVILPNRGTKSVHQPSSGQGKLNFLLLNS